MNNNHKHLKEKLLTEKDLVEAELKKVGRENPDRPGDWEALPPNDRDVSLADENTVADAIEGYEDNQAILATLEERYKSIVQSLEEIEEGTYGICEVCGKEIEEDRLEANPSAKTCKEHM